MISLSQTDLTPGESTVSPLKGNAVKRNKTAETSATGDNEKMLYFDTSTGPEGKEYGYDEEGLGFGREVDLNNRETREHHSNHG